MALVDIGQIVYPVSQLANGQSTSSANVADGKVGFVMAAPKTGNIDRFSFPTQTVTTGATVDCRIETVGTNGLPTGTLWGTNTNASQVINNADDNVTFEVTLTAPAAVTRGDVIAIVISHPTVSFGAVAYRYMLSIYSPSFPYPLQHNGTSWSKLTGSPAITLHYDDGIRYAADGCIPGNNVTTLTVNSGTTPDEVGNKFSLPFKCECNGIFASFSGPASGTATIKIYDAASSLLASRTVNTNVVGSTSLAPKYYDFASAITLEKNTVYRMAIESTNGTSFSVSYIDTTSTNYADAWILGQNMIWTQRTDAGAWTDTSTQRAQMALLINKVYEDAGSGGGIVTQVYQ